MVLDDLVGLTPWAVVQRKLGKPKKLKCIGEVRHKLDPKQEKYWDKIYNKPFLWSLLYGGGYHTQGKP